MTTLTLEHALARARELAARDDTHISVETAERFLRSGGWSLDTVLELLDRHARERPQAPVLIDQDGTTLTWQELKVRSDAVAAALIDLGYSPGDCLGMQLPNWSEFCVAVLGAGRIGVRPTFIHTPYRAFEMEYILGLTEARGVLVPDTYRGTDHAALARQVRAKLPALRDVIVVRGQGAAQEGTLAFEKLLESGQGRPPAAEPPVSTDLFVLMFTSGTTARPKGVMHLHANLIAGARKYVEAFGFTPDDRWLMVTPITHLTAFGIPFLTGALVAGGSVVLLEAWDVQKGIELAEQYRATHFVGAPPMLIDVARSEELGRRDLSALRFMMYAGAPCPVDILRRLHDRLGCGLAVFYGWTEGLAHTHSSPDDPLGVTSVTVGRTVSGWESEVVGSDGRPVAAGETGEFWGRGPNLSPGYYRQPQFVSARYNADGWFMSGDLITRNADHTFTFVARMDDMINRGGQKLDPREVEELLYTHPKVEHALVVAMPDERLGERGCAFIVPRSGQTFTLEDLRSFLAERGLAKYKWPERVELIEALPMTPTGKIMRYELRERAQRLRAES